MGTNQNETRRFQPLRRVLRCSTANRSPLAFTLTELLVVITIIAILASLITAAAINALNKGKQTRITLELQQIAGSLEEFKNEFGAYPPNGMSNGQDFNGNDVFDKVNSDFVRMFKKAFPRHREPEGLIRALAGDTSGNFIGNPSPPLNGGMTGAEAIYFWLGGFSDDTQYPLSGPGGPSFDPSVVNGEVLENRNQRFDFDLARLVPRDANGAFDDSLGSGRFIEYDNPTANGGPRRRINLWLYAAAGSALPIAYFDASRYKPVDYDADMSVSPDPTTGIYAVKRLREGFDTTQMPAVGDLVFAEDSKFQVLHAGIDDAWGTSQAEFPAFNILNANSASDATTVLTFPEGPFIGDIADTCSNFTTGTLGDEQE